MAESDFSGPCIVGFDSSSSRCGPAVLLHWPNPRSPGSRAKSFRTCQGLGPRRVGRALAITPPPILPSVISTTSAPRLFQAFAAQWLAYALPYRRFAVTLTSANARLGADADRYSFTVVDFHLLLFAGFDRRTESLDYREARSTSPRLISGMRKPLLWLPCSLVRQVTLCWARAALSIEPPAKG
jgi:hypothetical protein